MAQAPDKKAIRIEAPGNWWGAIDAWRRQQDDIPSISESVRRLVLAAIEADTSGHPRGELGRQPERTTGR